MKNIFIFEDHDESLTIWRRKKILGLDLIHVDAHMDFGFQPVKAVEQVIKEATSLEELKRGLEYNLNFMKYEKDLTRQTNIGNYICPAMEDGIVKDFYWVIPGGLKEFDESLSEIKKTVKGLLRAAPKKGSQNIAVRRGFVEAEFLGRKLVVCILEKLPYFTTKTLLDIDTDFLVIESLLVANSTDQIAKRRPWISPLELTLSLKGRLQVDPEVTTIAYSVNGGFTPMIYKYMGDEVAYYLAPQNFEKPLEKSLKAGRHFNLFSAHGGKEYYQKAVKTDRTYRAYDNNYGPLYLTQGKLLLAEEQFKKILKVDPHNFGARYGLGRVAWEKKSYREALKYFKPLLKVKSEPLFEECRKDLFFQMGLTEFYLKNYKEAKRMFQRHIKSDPLHGEAYCYLASLYEKENKYETASNCYKDSIRLGLLDIKPLERLCSMVRKLQNQQETIQYVTTRLKAVKRGITGNKADKTLRKKIVVLENKLKKVQF